MNSSSVFSRRRNGSVALLIAKFALQILLTTQLYSSFGRIPATVSAASAKNQVPYRLLATVLQEKLSQTSEYDEAPSVSELTKTLSKLASNQQTFKGLDGVAHEAYQRTHSGDDVTDTSIIRLLECIMNCLNWVSILLHVCASEVKIRHMSRLLCM